MWWFAVGCHILCYCLFLPQKLLQIYPPHVLFTSCCGWLFYQFGCGRETQFYEVFSV